MIKGNCAQSVVPRYGEKFNSFGLLRCPYWSIVKMWLLLYWEICRPFFEMRLFWEFLFRVLRKTDQKTAKNDLEWRMHSLWSYVFETNQHVVGSARIAGLCLTDEVELEQSWQEGRLVWSVKIRRVRLTRCVFRYGRWDGMTWEQERTSRHFKLAGQERWRRLGGRFASTVL